MNASMKIHKRLSELPVFAPVCLRLISMMAGQSEPEPGVVADLIESDASLASQVLGAANSSLYGFRAPILSIRHAVMLLGIEEVKSLVLNTALLSYFNGGSPSAASAALWQHSLAAALLSQKVASWFGARQDVAYSCGLLHDFGRIALMSAAPGVYGRLSESRYEKVQEILDAEERTFGMPHTVAGVVVMSRFQFPSDLVRVAGHHHDGGPAGPDLARVTHLGCRLADAIGFPAIPHAEEPIERIQAEIRSAGVLCPALEPAEWQERVGRLVSVFTGSAQVA